MKIAVVGATEMIGHHTAHAIQQASHDLYVVHRARSNLDRIADLRFESLVGDLDDRASLTRAPPAPKLSSTAIAVMAAGQLLDGSKARDALGFEAEVSLEDALTRTLSGLRARGDVRPAG